MSETTALPRVSIRYCRRCRFVLRAGWLAQELLFSLGDRLGEVALVPGEGGVFEVAVDGECVFSRADAGRFPESAELKRLVRDRIAPEVDLGHSEQKPTSQRGDAE
ncbi:SelT/SelW/SelH family protein [Arhodomonas sp. AD133]|uniref:SelT/SelW/SelH family protein n=1 Tax=Arhodomonas sp. AD133 TaxID=3415009 RepID=UPI003EBACCBC